MKAPTDVSWYPGADDDSDGVSLSLRDNFGGAVIGLWAGGELDPAYLSAAAARTLADELPELLRQFADAADAANLKRGA